jgi:hypothetical protein
MNRNIAVVAALIFFCIGSYAQRLSPEITAEELRQHVKYLASDELEGRGSGTEGNRKAAAYIAEAFRAYGLKPAGANNGYFQDFEFVAAVKLGTNNSLLVQWENENPRSLVVDQDFRPLGFTTNARVSGTAVFAGYGISAPDLKYDDYEGLDVKDRVVIVLRYGPDGQDIHSEFYRFTSLRDKARQARERGAAALVVVDAHTDELVKLTFDQSHASSDSIKVSRKPVSFALPSLKMTIETDVIKVKSRTANVLGYLEGTDPQHKDEVLVIGAHFDHLGYGGEGSGSLVPHLHEIHNGADDNASGTAALLELAQKFASMSSRTRTLLFIAFSGEELGTLGSQYYVNNPFFPLERTIAMINMDEVGRLNQNVLTVYGTGTSPTWNALLTKYNTTTTLGDTFALKFVPDGFGPSDHAQFYGKNIPVLFFFTGTHNDYHKPSDDWDKINYEGEERIVRYIYTIADDIQRATPRPQFVRAEPATPGMGAGDSRGFTVTLGVIPDYAEGTEGMKIGGTRPNGPADKAGLKAGDIIIALAGKKVMNIYDYMGILGELKVGQVVEVEVLRDGKRMTFSATMQKR